MMKIWRLAPVMLACSSCRDRLPRRNGSGAANGAVLIHTARAKICAADAKSVCLGNDPIAQGPGGWKYDVHGAVDFATSEILKCGGKVTYFAWAFGGVFP